MRETLIKACKAGGEEMKRHFHSDYQTSTKSHDFSLVTEADKASEKAILDVIGSAFPEHAILSEESGTQGHYDSQNSDSYRWIIDPIDGTTNFFHKSPFCGVSIALERGNELILGGVYLPFFDQFFLAEKGKGASLNGTLFTTPPSTMPIHHTTALLYNIDKFYGRKDRHQPLYQKIIDHNVHSRKMGASALDLCWVAMGRITAFVSAYPVNLWDVAAGLLVVQEAGGIVSRLNGDIFSLADHQDIIAGSPTFVRFFST